MADLEFLHRVRTATGHVEDGEFVDIVDVDADDPCETYILGFQWLIDTAVLTTGELTREPSGSILLDQTIGPANLIVGPSEIPVQRVGPGADNGVRVTSTSVAGATFILQYMRIPVPPLVG